ncbi:MAG: hypothetical protein O7D29_05455, partial [Gemmatimonadetes bacterium]|nr:hypothetical protein [Gemmatimonadota bacterium]
MAAFLGFSAKMYQPSQTNVNTVACLRLRFGLANSLPPRDLSHMPSGALISTTDLASNVESPQWLTIDCRFSLRDTDIGRNAYLESHIPGALYAHLDDDLSGPVVTGQTGRHPLPSVEQFVDTLAAWG